LKLHNKSADIFVPDGQPVEAALRRITHVGIGAHQDDLEFMAFHGIVQCYSTDNQWFGGITCTNGGGSARVGAYANHTDEQMQAVRRQEQKAAATIGRYGLMAQLDHPSRVVKNPSDITVKEDLKQLLGAMHPQIVYTHNPADKHDTHIGVVIAALQAMRELPAARRPQKVWGCEVWRDLDWLPDDNKVRMDVSGHEELAAALNSVFDSQIAGGKRYDLAVLGRRHANATFFESHATDRATAVIFGIDLTLLVVDESRDIVGYVCRFIDEFKADVKRRLCKQTGQ
jgi:LmbE family N-acetylglucosaminyl deacetylase